METETENQEAEARELEYERSLRQARNAEPEESANTIKNSAESENETANTTAPLPLDTVISAISDGADFTGIGALPIIGDALDVGTSGLKILLLWNTAKEARIKVIMVTAVIPLLIETVLALIIPILNDLLPSFIVGSLIGRIIINRTIKNTRKKLENIVEV